MSTDRIQRLFNFCRKGNLFDAIQIIEDPNENIDLNVRDEWDSTPLYYACLCGHEKLVEYLLQHGAKCNASTFDGERCLYSALTQNIKKMLKDYKAISKDRIRRSNYVEFFRRSDADEKYKDIYFLVHGVYFSAHRIVLSTRSSYFARMFATKWRNRKIVKINNKKVSIIAFDLLLSYIYTDRVDIPIEELENVKMLLKQCCLTAAIDKMEKIEKEYFFYAATKPKSFSRKITMLSVIPQFNSTELNESYSIIAPFGIPYTFRESQYPYAFPDLLMMDLPDEDIQSRGVDMRFLCDGGIPVFYDIEFTIGLHKFHGHKLFFCGRSEYFNALVHFAEVTLGVMEDGVSRVILNDISPEVFSIVFAFVYTDFAHIPNELTLEVLHFACLYILPTLKAFCVQKLKDYLDSNNACCFLKAARLYELALLELACTEFMANHLEEFVDNDEFISLIRSDASEIKNREVVDSIPIVDDINFHLYNCSLPMSQVCASVETKLDLLDSLLESLQLN